jgi:hypothetical protein
MTPGPDRIEALKRAGKLRHTASTQGLQFAPLAKAAR